MLIAIKANDTTELWRGDVLCCFDMLCTAAVWFWLCCCLVRRPKTQSTSNPYSNGLGSITPTCSVFCLENMECTGPGTYRIINVASNTAVTVPEIANGMWCIGTGIGVEISRYAYRIELRPDLTWLFGKWYLQRSGIGRRFKICQYGHYLTVSDTSQSSLLRIGDYPTSWSVFKNENDHNMYMWVTL